MIHTGEVKLFAENGYYFKIYNDGDTFGDADTLCGIRRNGSAVATTHSKVYRISKQMIDQVINQFPEIKSKMTEEAFDEQKTLTHLRFKLLQKNPVFG